MSLSPCPFDQASFWSKMTFWWMNSLFRAGWRRKLEPEDIYAVPADDEARLVETQLSECWRRELEKHGDTRRISLFYIVLSAFQRHWILPCFLIFISDSVLVIQPFFVGQLITYFSPSSDMSVTEAYLYGGCLGLSAFIQVFTNPLYFFLMSRVGMRMRTAMAGLIYRKCLTLTTKCFAKTTSGNIVNLLSTDIEKIIFSLEHLHYLWMSPIHMAVIAYLLYKMVGVSCLFGLALLLVLLPAEVVSGHMFGKLRLRIGSRADKRIHMMTEILSGMRVIKMYCWEKPFSKLINSLRNKEIKTLKQFFVIRAVMSSVGESSPRLMTLFIFVGHWLSGYTPLPLQNIFMTLGWVYVMRYFTYFLYASIETTAELVSSLSRIKSFLVISDESCNQRTVNRDYNSDIDSDIVVEVKAVSATWATTDISVSPSKDETHPLVEMQGFSLNDIHLNVQKGELMAVVGPIGAGKSSLLSIILEELPYTKGQITVCGSHSYSAQQPWVFSGTIRDNILFGDKFDASRYEMVVDACALSKDISGMPHGDQTLVGERGLLLSGGQKARVTLARERDIYLLDDPLSAVDVKVGKHIFNKCICGLLKGKTRVLVTHQLQYLKTADRIVVMDNGKIISVGSYADFVSNSLDLSSLVISSQEEDREDSGDDVSKDDITFKVSDTAEKVEEESRDTGSVGLDVYLKYLRAGKGIYFVPALFLFCAASQGLYAYGNWLLAQLSENNNPAQFLNTTVTFSNTSQVLQAYNFTDKQVMSPSLSRNWFTMPVDMRFYIVTCVLSCFSMLIYCNLVLIMTAEASRTLHNDMFKYILGSRTRFFDVNPVGRILNRFARDIGFLDSTSGVYLSILIRLFFHVLIVLILTIVVFPWLILPVIPIVILIVFIRYFAIQTARDIRRIEGVARSPVYSHVSETINGLQTIRAMKKEDQFYTHFVKYQNAHTSAWFIFMSSHRWFSIRSIFVLAAYTALVNFICVALGNTVPRSLLAVALQYCTELGEPFEWFIRLTADFENLMTSTERVVSYTKIDQEGPVTTTTSPKQTWPSEGNIIFKNVFLRYSDDTRYVLKHLNFDIKAKEKIGIIGRTGAGKSSLLSAMFRLTEPEGAIIIDDIDVTKIGLNELRSKISAIPQDPVLFTGRLRYNLDPFGEFQDDAIWNALQQVQLEDKVKSSPGQLDMEVTESGNNFSVGERQLICMARALLRHNKIIVLDEATANVDNRTDELIQRTIREQFQDSTVVTIAHRLHTVIDYDRIMVLDEGMVKEFDVPYLLLENKDSFLRQLVKQMGRQHEELLVSNAKEAMK